MVSHFTTARRADPHKRELGYPEAARSKLIEAAGPVFAERGYGAATIREICMQAGANVAAVNYYFRDKLGLYTEVLERSVRGARIESVRQALESNVPPEQALRAAIRTRLQSVSRGNLPDWHFRIMAHEFAQPSPAMARLLKTVFRPIYERLLDLIGEIIGLPSSHETTRLCTHSVMGQMFLYVLAGPVLLRLWPELEMTSAQVDRIADHIADFSLAYLQEVRLATGQKPRNEHTRRGK